jgi:alpha-glucosidase
MRVLIVSLENHDQPRVVSRITSDHPEDRSHCAKLLAMFHCSLTGTIFVYQGQEIGLANVPREWGVEEYKDIETIQHMEGELAWRRQSGKPEDKEGLQKEMRMTARDNGRTPMQVSWRVAS